MQSTMLPPFENLPPEAIELLEAAGHTDIKSVFEHSYDELSNELIKANNILGIVGEDLNEELLSSWLKSIEQQAGKELVRVAQTSPVNQGVQSNATEAPETLSQINENVISQADLEQVPEAIPLSKNFIEHNNLNLKALPAGKIYNTNSDTLSRPPVRHPVKQNLPVGNYDSGQSETNHSALFDKESTKSAQTIDTNRILSMEEYQKEGSKIAQPEAPKQNNITKTTRKETNAGVHPDSKFFIKGVLHQDIPRFKIGSYSLILVHLLVISSVALFSLVFVDKDTYWWAVFSPLLLLPALFIFLTLVRKASCPICTQKMYGVKRCLKHRNAHRWPILGYMLPTCLHALFFKWFRCIFCGTSVRLKE